MNRPLEPSGGRTRSSAGEVLAVFTRLGLTSFGGPIAHLAYFHREFVHRRRWLDEQSYADLVAMCQMLPGPASSQVGIALGLRRAGWLGGLLAWLGFTLPSAAILTAFAFALKPWDPSRLPWLHGLMIAAAAVVAQAVWSMARSLAWDRVRGTIAILAAVAVLFQPSPATQLLVIGAAGLAGRLLLPKPEGARTRAAEIPISKFGGALCWILFFGLLAGLPLLESLLPPGPFADGLAVFDRFYRAGALVFGGGHVVLPLLQSEFVPRGWISVDEFLAGYGVAQAVPGPLFTFAAYLGAAAKAGPGGLPGALLGLIAVFLPAFLLVIGALPFWNALRARPGFQTALAGINAAVVGLLGAALYHPVWTETVRSSRDFCLVLAAFGMLALWKAPPWVVVLFAAFGELLATRLS